MSRYSGPQGHGAATRARADRKAAAEIRNAQTPQERTAWFRRQRTRVRAALDRLEREAAAP